MKGTCRFTRVVRMGTWPFSGFARKAGGQAWRTNASSFTVRRAKQIGQVVKPIIPDSANGVVRNDRTGEERAVTCHFISDAEAPGTPPTNDFVLALDGRRWTAESVSGDTFTLQLEDGRRFRIGTIQANGLLTIAGQLP